jgi:hypothetical protein
MLSSAHIPNCLSGKGIYFLGICPNPFLVSLEPLSIIALIFAFSFPSSAEGKP